MGLYPILGEPPVYLAIVYLTRPLVKAVAYIVASYKIEATGAHAQILHHRYPNPSKLGEWVRERRFQSVEV